MNLLSGELRGEFTHYLSTDKNGWIRMEIIAIGPRDKKKVYRMAAERIVQFREETEKR